MIRAKMFVAPGIGVLATLVLVMSTTTTPTTTAAATAAATTENKLPADFFLKSKPLEELKPGDDLSRWVFRLHEPSWMDACDHRPPPSDEPLIFNLPEIYRKHARSVIEQDKRDRGTFLKKMAARRGVTLSPESKRELDAIAEEFRTSTPRPRSRIKRSIESLGAFGTPPVQKLMRLAGKNLKLYKQASVGLETQSSSALMFKQPLKSAKSINSVFSTWSSTKKTSFSLSKLKTTNKLMAPSGGGDVDKPHAFHPEAAAKNRYFVQPSGHLAGIKAIKTSNTTKPQETTQTPLDVERQRASDRLQEIVPELVALEEKLSWYVVVALNTLFFFKDHRNALASALANATSKMDHLDGERVAEIERQQGEWLPQIDDLIVASKSGQLTAREAGLFNMTGGMNDQRQLDIWVDLAHYLQFFGVAFEQMKYDLAHTGAGNQLVLVHGKLYEEVDQHAMKLLCELEAIFNLMTTFRERRAEFDKLYAIYKQPKLGDHELFVRLLSERKLDRDVPYEGGAKLKSPIKLKYERLSQDERVKLFHQVARYSPEYKQLVKKPGLTNSTLAAQTPEHIWREIMPLEARQLASQRERFVRDKFIIDRLGPLIEAYKSLIMTNLESPIDY